MTLEEFETMLSRHDFWYSYSDDHRVYTKGEAESKAIREAVKSNPEFKPVYQEYIKRMEG